MCPWTGYGFVLSVPNRVYNFVRVCPNCKQGIACTIYVICLMNLLFSFLFFSDKQLQFITIKPNYQLLKVILHENIKIILH